MFNGRKSNAKSGAAVESLHDRVSVGLARGFKGSLPHYSLGVSEADLLVRQGQRVAVFEIKTGDPDLPLPSSTSSQMLLLQQQARRQFPEPDVAEVLPVLVTNYKVSPDDEKELEDQGIKLVRFDPSSSLSYDSDKFSRHVANLTGLHADVI